MTPAPTDPWLIAVDRGGTFTDCCATDPSGLTHRAKLLSSGRLRAAISLPVSQGITSALAIPLAHLYPTGFFENWTAELFHPDFPATVVWRAAVHDSGAGQVTFLSHLPDHLPPGTFLELYTGEPAPVVGVRLLTGTRLGQPFPPHRFRLATTLATNALLENQGAAVAFFVTRGFRDLLTIGDQRRADLFALHHQRDRPLHRHTVEVIERLDSSGSVLIPPDSEALASQAAVLVGQGVHTAAVALAHSDLNPAHERAVREILITAGFTSVSLSSELSAQIKLLPRAQTAVVDAALAPVMSTFIQRVRAALGRHAWNSTASPARAGWPNPDPFTPRIAY